MNCERNRVLVAAHRGDCQSGPENSLAGIEASLALGVDILEIDIRWTRDGELVVLHDRTLDRTTTGTGPVQERSWGEVRALGLRDQQGELTEHRVPRLVEVMRMAKDRCLVCLDKSEECLAGVMRVLEETGTVDQAIFLGKAAVHEVRLMFGEVFGRIRYLPQVNDSTPEPGSYIRAIVETCRPWAFAAKYEREDSAILALLPEIRRAGVHVWVTPSKPSMCAGRTDALALEDAEGNWGWVIDRGADIVCTNHPAELLRYLRRKGWHR